VLQLCRDVHIVFEECHILVAAPKWPLNLQVVEEIAAAQEALELLIPAGDFGGALDVLADLTAAGRPMHVAGFHAFRHLPQQLAAAEEVGVVCPCKNMHGQY